MKSTLPQRLREAAAVLEEVSALSGYRNVDGVNWTPKMLRREADVLEEDLPA